MAHSEPSPVRVLDEIPGRAPCTPVSGDVSPAPSAQPAHGTRFEDAGQRAVAWISAHLPRLDPFVSGELTADGIKALSEFGIVYSVLEESESALPWIRNSIDPWRSFLIGHCEDPRYAQMARKRPRQAVYLLMPYFVLRATGYRNPYHEETLHLLARWCYPDATEVVPHRYLDRQYFLWKAGCLAREPAWRRLYRATSVPHMLHPQYLDIDAIYTVTHTLFYLTDFGRRPPPLSAREVRQLSGLSEYLLIHLWRLSQWDLLGELLISLGRVQNQHSRSFTDAAQAFCGAQDEDGSVPPAADREAAHSSPTDQPAETRFRDRYHTTFVMAMCAVAHSR